MWELFRGAGQLFCCIAEVFIGGGDQWAGYDVCRYRRSFESTAAGRELRGGQ